MAQEAYSPDAIEVLAPYILAGSAHLGTTGAAETDGAL